jgi:Protein of unknown function (DUF3631)
MPSGRARKQGERPNLWQLALDAERRVIASCLLTTSLLSKCGALTPTHLINSDCRAVWSGMPRFRRQGDSWDSSSVASELHNMGTADPEATLVRLTEGADGRPWPAFDHSGPITPNVLARLLAPFDIFPRILRSGRSVVKGYKRVWFSDGWNRYLTPLAPPEPGPTDATPLPPAKELTQVQLNKKPPEPDVAASKTTLCRIWRGLCAVAVAQNDQHAN